MVRRKPLTSQAGRGKRGEDRRQKSEGTSQKAEARASAILSSVSCLLSSDFCLLPSHFFLNLSNCFTMNASSGRSSSARVSRRTASSRRNPFLIRRVMRSLRLQARRQDLISSGWPVTLCGANARKIPTAVPDSAGSAEWPPIATINSWFLPRRAGSQWREPTVKLQ